MNQLDYVDICPGESVLFKWNLREFRMIYAFCSTKKRYYKTFVHIINNKYYFHEKYLNIFNDYPYIFNLGHGILPETKPEMIQYIIQIIKLYFK